MPWQKLHLSVKAAELDKITVFLESAGASSITVEDAGDNPIYEPSLQAPQAWPDNNVSALFTMDVAISPLIDLLEVYLAHDAPLQYQTTILEDQVWERVCLDNFHPLHFGNHLWICPSWHKVDDPKAIVVQLDPGLAYGTGTHATTQLCLKWLANNAVKNKTVIDYGCGSGILSLAAYKLGAQKIIAVDNDPQALTATRENASRNQVNLNNFFIYTPEQMPTLKAEIIIANILAGPLIDLADKFINYLANGGQIVLSGILAPQIEKVQAAYKDYIAFDEPVIQEEWARLSGIKY